MLTHSPTLQCTVTCTVIIVLLCWLRHKYDNPISSDDSDVKFNYTVAVRNVLHCGVNCRTDQHVAMKVGTGCSAVFCSMSRHEGAKWTTFNGLALKKVGLHIIYMNKSFRISLMQKLHESPTVCNSCLHGCCQGFFVFTGTWPYLMSWMCFPSFCLWTGPEVVLVLLKYNMFIYASFRFYTRSCWWTIIMQDVQFVKASFGVSSVGDFCVELVWWTSTVALNILQVWEWMTVCQLKDMNPVSAGIGLQKINEHN